MKTIRLTRTILEEVQYAIEDARAQADNIDWITDRVYLAIDEQVLSTARFYGVSCQTAAEMLANQALAFDALWAPPGEREQLQFEADWFEDHGYTEAADYARQAQALLP
jgi:shikimate 5-dehydrogenase